MCFYYGKIYPVVAIAVEIEILNFNNVVFLSNVRDSILAPNREG